MTTQSTPNDPAVESVIEAMHSCMFSTPKLHSFRNLKELHIGDEFEDGKALRKLLDWCSRLESLTLSTTIKYDSGKSATSLLRGIATSNVADTLLFLDIDIYVDFSDHYEGSDDFCDHVIPQAKSKTGRLKVMVLPNGVLHRLKRLQTIKLSSRHFYTSSRRKKTKRPSQILP